MLGAVLILSSYPSEIDNDNRTGEGENIPAPDGVVATPPLGAGMVAAVEEPWLDVDVVAAVEEPWLDVNVLAVVSPPEDALLVAATCSSAASCRGTPENRGGMTMGVGLGVAVRYLFRHRPECCSLTEGEPRRCLVLENEVSVEIDIVVLIGRGVCRNDNRMGEGENIPGPDGVVAAPPVDVDVVAAVEEPWLDVGVPAVVSPPEDVLLVAATCSSVASCRGTPENRGEAAVGVGLGVAARYLFRHR